MNQNDEVLDTLYEGTSASRHSEMEVCHFCGNELHQDNNAMVRTLTGKPLASRGFSWVTVMIEPFQEVPCCDICLDTVSSRPEFLGV